MMITRSISCASTAPGGGSGCVASKFPAWSWPDIPLEDDFGDILRKAMKGTGTQAGALAREIGVDAATIAAWQKYVGTADDDASARDRAHSATGPGRARG